jgi:hypothetical protein
MLNHIHYQTTSAYSDTTIMNGVVLIMHQDLQTPMF